MILTTLVVAVALGMAAQLVSERFQVPAILPLLVLGVLLGPAGLALFDPHSLGETMEVLVHLGVAIILFEGGLSLDPRQLAREGAAVRNLLTIGMVVTWGGCTWIAFVLVPLPLATAALFGAVVTVTGPTVIAPLLRHMIAPRRLKTVLMSEGLIIDPIGAVLAYLVLQVIGRSGGGWRPLGMEMVELAVTGAVIGFVAGALARVVVRSRSIDRELRNLSVLALLMLCFLISEHNAPQSGILASVVMGLTMSAAELPDLVSLRAFKGQLTTLVISVLFILLAGQLDLGAVAGLGWRGVAVVAAMILLVRPLSVLVSVWPRHMPWQDRLSLAMMAPRGIVAAAVASLAARQLAVAGVEGASLMEGLVYLAIMVTGAWATLMALVLPRALGYLDDPERRRIVLVGANPLSERVARLVGRTGRKGLLIDSSFWRLDRYRAADLETVCGDARDAATYEEAGVERDTMVVALTTNDELNLLVAELVHQEFGVEHPVVGLQNPPEELGRRSRAWVDLLGGRGMDVPRWTRLLEGGRATCLEVDPEDHQVESLLKQLQIGDQPQVVALGAWSRDQLTLDVGHEPQEGWTRMTILVAEGKASELLQPFDLSAADDQEEGDPAGEGEGG